MAANVPARSHAKDGPLSSFERISKLVYFYRPDNGRKPSAPPGLSSPKLILVAGWMDARELHLAKYTTRLQAMYPDSAILIVRCFIYHFTRNRKLFPQEIEPAVPIIRSIMDETGADGEGPQMLIHAFSNGGSTMLMHLYNVYRRLNVYKDTARRQEAAVLPPHVTIFDSAPGLFQWSRSVIAMTMGLAKSNWVVRLFMTAVCHFSCALYWIMHVPWGRLGYLGQTYNSHNDRAKNQTEVQRTYMYSEEDELIDYKDVEGHAATAERIGYRVRLEKFIGTAHVAHVRGDEERYWSIVKETWEAGMAGIVGAT